MRTSSDFVKRYFFHTFFILLRYYFFHTFLLLLNRTCFSLLLFHYFVLGAVSGYYFFITFSLLLYIFTTILLLFYYFCATRTTVRFSETTLEIHIFSGDSFALLWASFFGPSAGLGLPRRCSCVCSCNEISHVHTCIARREASGAGWCGR